MNKSIDNALIEMEDGKEEKIKNKWGKRLKRDSKESDRDRGSQRQFNIFIICS